MPALEAIERNYLLYFIVPIWIASGFADWWLHRRSRIEVTSGIKESFIHAAMLVELGLPITLGLFSEINALLCVIMVLALVAHEATAVWDVTYAVEHRSVVPAEQHVHSALEMLPLLVVSFLICMHWQQFIAIVGMGSAAADWAFSWKEHPLSGTQQGSVLAAVGVFLALPYLEELIRCARHVVAVPRHREHRAHA